MRGDNTGLSGAYCSSGRMLADKDQAFMNLSINNRKKTTMLLTHEFVNLKIVVTVLLHLRVNIRIYIII